MKNTICMLNSTNGRQMMSFVLTTSDGGVFLIDGGYSFDVPKLLNYLKEVCKNDKPHIDAIWLTHPHSDHIWAFVEMIKNHRDEFSFDKVYYHFGSEEYLKNDPDVWLLKEFNNVLCTFSEKTSFVEIGDRFDIKGATFEVLYVTDETINNDVCNNSSTVFTIKINDKKILILGDCGAIASELIATKYGNYLSCDYVQMAHQYDQACNQINAISFKEHSIFATNGLDAQVFGLEPEFGCCTANHGQGWPKFVRSSFMKSNDGIEVVVPIPCKLKTQWDGSSVQISLRTNYPFRNAFKYVVYCEKATNMKLHIRIPDYVDKLFVNGKEIKHKDHYDINGFVKGITIINVEYKYKPILCPHYKDLHYVQCGSLVYSLFLNKTEAIKEYEKDGVIRKFPYCDYEYRTTDSWSYAFAETNLEIKKRRMNKCPFSSIESPLYLNVKMIPIDWGYEDGFDSVCASYPKCNKRTGNVEVKKFVPYGCTKLRMTEMPLIKK